jgi:hypothetical protein
MATKKKAAKKAKKATKKKKEVKHLQLRTRFLGGLRAPFFLP